MMHASNLIHGLTFELAYDGQELTSESLAEWLREVLLPVVDETLAQHDQPQQVCRIERLEIDLGELLRDDVEGELALRLHQRLAAALDWSMAPAATGAEAGAAAGAEHAEGAAEQLLSYLRSGRLPWSVAVDQQAAHEQLLQRVLALPEAKSVLGKATQDRQMLTRLVRQFAPATLSQIVLVLHGVATNVSNPSEADWLSLLSEGHSRSVAGQAPAKRPAVEPALSHRVSKETQSELAGQLAGDIGIVEQALRRGDLAAVGTPAKPVQPDVHDSSEGSTDVILLAQALQDGEVALLTRIWAATDQAQRQKFKLQWRELPYQTQQRYLKSLAQNLTETQFNEFLTLVDLASARQDTAASERARLESQLALQDDDIAQLAIGRADERDLATRLVGDFGMVEQALRRGDLAAVGTPAKPVQPDVHDSSEGSTDVILLEQALQDGEIAQLTRIWAATDHAQRQQFKLVWRELPYQTQQRYLNSLAQNLTETQFNEFLTLVDLASARQDDDIAQLAIRRADERDLATGLGDDIGMVEQALRRGDLAAAGTPVKPVHPDVRDSSEGSTDVILLEQALQDGEIAQLTRIWAATDQAQRQKFKLQWRELPHKTQQRYLNSLAQNLTETQFNEFLALVDLASAGQDDDIAQLAIRRADERDLATRLGGDFGMVEQALRRGDLAAAGTPAKPVQPDVRDSSEGSTDVILLAQALQDGEVAQLTRIWAASDHAQRQQFKLQWRELPYQTQQGYLNSLAQILTETQFNELVSLVGPTSARQGAAASQRTRPESQQLLQDGDLVESVDPLAALGKTESGWPFARSSANASVDIALLARMWSTIDSARRQDFKLQWRGLGAQTQQDYLHALEQALTVEQFGEFVALVGPLEISAQPAEGVDHPLSTPDATEPQIDPALAMFRDWQRYKLDLPNVKLTLPELKQWLNWWLMHDPRLVNQDCSLMLEAIDRQCAQLQDAVQFMKLVLTTLRDDEALDVEALAAQAMSQPSQVDKPIAMDAIGTLSSQQAIRNFVVQQMVDDDQLGGLNSAQLHQLVRAWIGDASSLFLAAIEDQALLAQDIHVYFRSILQSLLSGQAVDLECLVGPDVPVAVALTQSGLVEELPAVGPSPLPLLLQQSLPQKLAEALLHADLAPLRVIWPEILRFHAGVLMAAARRYLCRPQERARLVAQGDWEMVAGMLEALSPETGRQIAPLVLHAAACNALLPEPMTVDVFRQRLLSFGFERVLGGGEGRWLDGVMRALEVGSERADDVAHAWRAILPPGRSQSAISASTKAPAPAQARASMLDSALFGEAADQVEAVLAAAPYAAVAGSEASLAVLLMRSDALTEVEQHLAGLLMERMLGTEGEALNGALESALGQPAAIARLTGITPGPVLAQLLLLLQPALAAQLPAALSAIAGAAAAPGPIAVANVPAMQSRHLWSAIYQAAFVAADPVAPAEFIRALVHSVSGRTDAQLPQPAPALTRAETLKTLLQPMAVTEPEAAPQQPDGPAWTGESNIRNAGMVIFATYMQRLFGILELTSEGKFVSDDAAQRAVHLVQYAVTGEAATPEYQLVLNKLFCGIHGGLPIARGIDITPKEKETIEQMLHGVIAHWSALGKTSVGGLRQTFLQREGHLYFEEDAWHLKIPQATFDMLLDRLPWSFSMIKFPWMEYPLHVTWR